MDNKMVQIGKFAGEYFWLSNFYPCEVEFEGLTYRNAEAAFQSAKVLDRGKREIFTRLGPSDAKFQGKRVTLRPDWEAIKEQMMYKVLVSKFRLNPEIRQKLLDTKEVLLIEGNIWGDTYWGVCNGVGENKLGKLLMKVREEIRLGAIPG